MLDRSTGEIALASGPIGPGTKPSALEGAERDRSTYKLRGAPIDERAYTLVARFEKSRLVKLTLIDDDPKFGTSWDDYTEENEQARRRAHDKALTRDLGAPHRTDDAHFIKEWTFAWGKVTSSHDPRDGITAITIRYQ